MKFNLKSLLLASVLSVCAVSANAADVKEIKVGVVGDYVAQWDTVNEILKKDNLKVKLVRYSDYATPNRALHDGEIDLNAFQHKAFLNNDIERNGYEIVDIGDTIITPLCVFNNKDKIKSIEDIKDGDIIAIPSDLTNGGRALKVLEAAGLIKVDPSKGYTPTKADITEYVKKIKIREAESGILARILPDVSAALINGGNAYTANLNPSTDSVYQENIDPKVNPAAAVLINVIAAKKDRADDADLNKVVEAYQTDAVADTILEAYKGAFLPAWAGAKGGFVK
ncbi:MetQ/NlpA family ABC transporter substrate-binding protein [Succinivibrio dextrinosolvens]|uniref:MetQ/NlpA family ABC transporter substrate-binding protein n=1 Tax=Succinivibrio dextrinosolvens TaxID=83771 RepID=UPI00241F10F1|nr:MetQ/NlpA family ABC transporter substrate-binding protein [Succinivibrio dextrinosolvens]MBE6421954.1 MetQ/NlpA family ABC transporter substrate-binding protein [Succinivibrio dextrinosolvens]